MKTLFDNPYLECVFVGLLGFDFASVFQTQQAQVAPHFRVFVVENVGFRQSVFGFGQFFQLKDDEYMRFALQCFGESFT